MKVSLLGQAPVNATFGLAVFLKLVNQKTTPEAFDCVRHEVSAGCMEHVGFEGHVDSGLGLILQAEIQRLN